MKGITLLILALLFSVIGKTAFAQDITPPSDLEVYLVIAPGDTTNVFGDTTFSPNTKLVGTVMITLQDTVYIQTINVSMGTTNGGADLFQKNFSFDNKGTFSDGTSYKRVGMNVYLGIGNYTGLNNFYAQVVLQDNSGYSTPPVSYNPNN